MLFLTGEGEAITPGHLSDQVSTYIDAAEIGKKGSCHLFRHIMATLMLEGGAAAPTSASSSRCSATRA